MFSIAEYSAPSRPRRASDYEVRSVRKAMEILCAFTPETPLWTLTEFSLKLKIPKSTALNLLRTLERFDLITKDPGDNHYHLGLRIFQLSPLLSQNAKLVMNAQPHLRLLAEQTGETVKLGTLWNGHVLILDAIESKFALHTRGDKGCLSAIHSTGLGKAVLAKMDIGLRQVLGQRRLKKFTDHTITAPKLLEHEVARVQSAGYALDREESEVGVHCIAATIPTPDGWPPAAVSISGPSDRFGQNAIEKFVPFTIAAGRAISASLVGPLRSTKRTSQNRSNM